MPRYYFHRLDGKRDPDREGLDLPSVDYARYEAINFAADTLKDATFALWDGGQVQIQVTDESQLVIFVVNISVVNKTTELSVKKIV